MSVYNDAGRLPRSLESVLEQEGVSFEFIIIDDGSNDASFDILNDYARQDSRIRIEKQVNTGLTRALRNGCSLAEGEFIARQDAGDVYRQEKLARQVRIFRERSEVSMVTCGTRFLGPCGEFLFDVTPTTEEVDRGLRNLDIKSIRGPSSHPSMMFRTNDYVKAGGYRPDFVVSQDMDLWLRLIEQGVIISIPEVLIEAEYTPQSISGSSRKLQKDLGKILIECALCRQRGESEADLLRRAAKLKRSPKQFASDKVSESNYFIGRLLQQNRDARCLEYLRRSIGSNPLNWRAWLVFLHSRVSSLNWNPGNSESS